MGKLRGILRIIVCSLGVLLMLVSQVYAEEFVSTIEVDIEDFKIVYRGKSGELPVKTVNLVVVEGNNEPNGMNVIAIDSVMTENEGEYNGVVYLDENISPGVYKVFVDSENGSASKSFLVINENTSKEFLNELNKKTTLADFEEYFRQNSEKFGIFYDEYSESFSYASQIVYSLKPISGYTTASAVYAKFIESNAIYCVINSNNIALELENRKETLSIDYSKYATLDDEVKSYLNELLKKEDYTKNVFSVIFLENLIYSEVKTSDKWTTMKEKILKYSSQAGIDLNGTYKKLADKDAVFQQMFKVDFTDYKSIAVSFDKIVNELYAAQQNNNSKPGPSGGGGGGATGFVNTGTVNIPSIESEKEKMFTDIEGHWGYKYIQELTTMGAISGYEDGSFRPDNYITRAEFTKIIVDVFDVVGESEIIYKDIKNDDWYYDAVKKASSNSLIFGYDEMFYPKQYITRQDAVVIVHRLLTQKKVQMKKQFDFIDGNEVSDYAVDAVSEMTGMSVIVGNEGRFFPKNNITRAEATKIISLAYELL